MLEILERIPAEAAGWIAIISGLSTLAAMLARYDRRKRARDAAREVQTVPFRPIRDWRHASASRDAARVAALFDVQARAARQIDAIEHAYDRMLAQCREVMGQLALRPQEPAREAASDAAATARPTRQPLAA